MDIHIIDPDLKGKGLSIGIVRSRFNGDISQTELDYCIEELNNLGVSNSDIVLVTVPGALEIGVALSHMIETYNFNAMIALGAVIRGDTFHFEIVSNEMSSAISNVSLSTGVPIANGVLTVDSEEQANIRAAKKGYDCARAAVEMSNLIIKLSADQEYEDE
ncbi:riboflavin synthase beta chain [Candidatus Kinetoplastibacterium blastocrithidii TCC012E]|uniref:6,7-dimethyl-8-ribityllumazine synthase n=1 Tax=Candidatus Kinetoplastidibacterium blastocrithidiae TCC012E TaxID=1208922 RepID=M1MD69_9PROT|nr:6,7-dimethyl-8-ribityllumazine synthase [Candidatus Kinetoplastibacterium blastocrithidii]AFZ83587.1 6,7-dimethyl-8-ribityllumazine synthase [Candidatus Kinetoplastibacterium blastocrithidii (ex Strigomonas culicis)]AGF49705.1 riboflavin synthase beta chain [Candidatus Kinetoplastibacterium blastocrithidii TCC012E]